MPNHVTNRLCITGPLKDREKFKATFNGPNERGQIEEFTFHQTVPMPEKVFRGNLSSEDERNYPGEMNWYGWGCANWGTKWSNYDTTPVEYTSRSIKIQFDTAWSAPDQWLIRVSKKFPTLKFCDKWKDEGGPRGTYTAKNGVLEGHEHRWNNKTKRQEKVLVNQ